MEKQSYQIWYKQTPLYKVLNHSLSLSMSVMAEAESKHESNPDLGINPSPPAIKSGFSFNIMAFGQFS